MVKIEVMVKWIGKWYCMNDGGGGFRLLNMMMKVPRLG